MKNVLTIQQAIELSNKINRPVIFITGVTGQDGSYMVDALLSKFKDEYLIFGGVRRASSLNLENIKHIGTEKPFRLIYFDLTDAQNINMLISNLKPAYFINFAAQSFVGASWDLPVQTWDTNTKSIIYILDSIRRFSPNTRFYQAGSSEEFGDVEYSPQNEQHPLKPRSPYGASKASARLITKVYRESYNIYTVAGWLFNHESERRGEEFVTRKITKGVAQISKVLKNGTGVESIKLGNIYTHRDWSHTIDMMDGVWRMLNQDKYNPKYNGTPKDYVMGSGETHTIKEFVMEAFKSANINGNWHKIDGDLETFVISSEGNDDIVAVEIDKNLYRPAEVNFLVADTKLAKNELGWIPKISFHELVNRMVSHDIRLINTEKV